MSKITLETKTGMFFEIDEANDLLRTKYVLGKMPEGVVVNLISFDVKAAIIVPETTTIGQIRLICAALFPGKRGEIQCSSGIRWEDIAPLTFLINSEKKRYFNLYYS